VGIAPYGKNLGIKGGAFSNFANLRMHAPVGKGLILPGILLLLMFSAEYEEAVRVKLDCEEVVASALPEVELPEEEIEHLEEMIARIAEGEYQDLRKVMEKL